MYIITMSIACQEGGVLARFYGNDLHHLFSTGSISRIPYLL